MAVNADPAGQLNPLAEVSPSDSGDYGERDDGDAEPDSPAQAEEAKPSREECRWRRSDWRSSWGW
jgi:hypothetical protein